jgi:amidase
VRGISGYTVCANLLGYTAAVLPVTAVDKSVDVVDEGYKLISETDEKFWKSCEFYFIFRGDVTN